MTFGGSLIQAQHFRDCVGQDRPKSPWDRLLPILGTSNDAEINNCLFYIMPSGSLLSEKFQGKSLRKQKFIGDSLSRSARYGEGLYRILTRDIGLGSDVAKVIVSRPEIHYRRIEEFISGLVDSLWIAEELSFLEGSSDKMLLRNLVRSIFAIGSVNLCQLMDMWKEWTNWFFHTYAETQTIGDLQEPIGNIFWALNGLAVCRRILNREGDQMLRMQELSHLISTRQMPYMGSKTEERSWKAFKEVLTQDYTPPARTIVQLGQAARRIGEICRKIRPTKIHPGCLHISVTSSGEYSYSTRKGAQAAAVADAINRILTKVPEVDSIETTPFGDAVFIRGIPLWKTLFREAPLVTTREFLSRYALIKGVEDRFEGLDQVLGEQIMYVAWKEASPTPVLRAEIVPEMGNKARIVTLSEYWLNVLQAPLAHLLIEAMKFHPSVFSSFHRQDQAFEAVKGLTRIKAKALRKSMKVTEVTYYEHPRKPSYRNYTVQEAVLSSDLKDATNAQNWEVTKRLLRSFIQGYGLSVRPEYINVVLDLIGPRIIELPGFDTIVSKTGIMMGEAIAKPSLTILNLAVEELAFIRYIEKEGLLFDSEPTPYRDWRYVHIGGDDHLARGPVPYLDLITQIHLSAGSHISPGQHGWSTRCVKYTERLLNLENLVYGEPFNQGDYSRSIIVDSVKVRLLERGQSTLMAKDNKNVAIGKSAQLGGCLEWLPTDDRYYTYDKKDSIRALFIERMGELLPRKAKNPRAFAAIHLPTAVGGYGLGLRRDTKKWVLASPEPTKWLVYQILQGQHVKKHFRCFRKLNTNTSRRGVVDLLQYQEDMVDELNSTMAMAWSANAYPGQAMFAAQQFRPLDWWELKHKFPSDNARRTIALAADNNILSVEEFVKRATRGNLFQELLIGGKDLSVFNTNKYVDTYRKVVWPYYEKNVEPWDPKPSFPQTSEQIATAITKALPMWFIDITETTQLPVLTRVTSPTGETHEEYYYQSGSFIKLHTLGLPSMNISPKRLGVRL